MKYLFCVPFEVRTYVLSKFHCVPYKSYMYVPLLPSYSFPRHYHITSYTRVCSLTCPDHTFCSFFMRILLQKNFPQQNDIIIKRSGKCGVGCTRLVHTWVALIGKDLLSVDPVNNVLFRLIQHIQCLQQVQPRDTEEKDRHSTENQGSKRQCIGSDGR